MSFIVRDAPMPQNCAECPCYQEMFEEVANAWWNSITVCGATHDEVDPAEDKRADGCPLFELKDWKDV